MDVSVIIVNYNTFQLTVDCVSSVYRHTGDIAFEVIVVDNASTSFDAAAFAGEFPELKLIQSKKNLGFAGGNNLGIPQATGKYILLLNSDTYLKDNAILYTFQYMERHPRAGVVSARLIFPDGRYQSVAQRFPSIGYQLMELLRLQKILPARVAGKLLLGAFFRHDENTTADWVWGAYFMFRKEILEHLPEHKLDDSYFMYFEDMQWCRDIKKLGYEVHYCAEAEVVHIMGGSAGKKNRLMEENEPLFLKRNFSPMKVWVIKKLQRLLAL